MKKTLNHAFGRAARMFSLLDGRVFYIGLALAMALWACANFMLHRESRMQAMNYDWMVRHRIHTPAPDPDIVILDIDEKSLAQMSADFGRWPWPRDVLAAVLAELEAQGARAVLFDILFSDPDKLNPASDKAFSEAVAASKIGFFAVLRLNPANDSKSEIHASDLPGLAVPLAMASAKSDPTLALVPPFFASAVASTRLGTHNVFPDPDGVIRRYHLWEEVDGFRILSLPERLALALNWPSQSASDKLVQWMDKPMAYKAISFSDIYFESQRREKTRARNEFMGKIVLVGATAPSLFDVKGTSLSAVHPGVDVLATVIDNTKNDRFLLELPGWSQLCISLALLALMAWLSIRFSHEQLGFAFLAAPSVLLAISWVSLNGSSVFLDLSGPASYAFLYFTLARIYSFLLRHYWSSDLAVPEKPDAGRYAVGILAVVLPDEADLWGLETRSFNLMRRHAPQAKVTINLGSGAGWLAGAFKKIVVASWVCDARDAAAQHRMRSQASKLAAMFGAEFNLTATQLRFQEREISGCSSAQKLAGQVRDLILNALHGQLRQGNPK